MGHHVVRLRLARWGRRNRPFYRIVATSSRRKRDGRHLEIVGGYNPLFHSERERQARIKRVWLNMDRIKYWLGSGAKPSETVARLLGTSGLLPISPRTERKRSSQEETKDGGEQADSNESLSPSPAESAGSLNVQKRAFSTGVGAGTGSAGLQQVLGRGGGAGAGLGRWDGIYRSYTARADAK